MKTILNLLKAVLRIGAQAAPEIVRAYNPALGALVGTVLNAVVNTEAAIGSGQGAVKATVASLLLDSKGADIAALFETAGKPVKNPELFATGVSKLQDGIVDLLNSTGEQAKVPEAK